MQTTMDLSGLWEVRLGDGAPATVHLPGTLEENGLGEPETPALESRLTRRFRWEGEAVFSREVTLPDHPGRRLILEAERARQLRLTVDGQPVPTLQGTLSTPYLFELTRWAGRRVRLCLLSDNRYPGWPREEIVHASAATDETQTNWNGLLGRLCVHSVADFWVRSVRVYPHGRTLDAAVDLAVPRQALDAVGDGELVLEGPALARPFCLLRRDWQPESLRPADLRGGRGTAHPQRPGVSAARGGQLLRLSRDWPPAHDDRGLAGGSGSLPGLRGQLSAVPFLVPARGGLCGG